MRFQRWKRFIKKRIRAGSWLLAGKICGVCQWLQRIFQRTIYFGATNTIIPVQRLIIFFIDSQYLCKPLSPVLHFFLLKKPLLFLLFLLFSLLLILLPHFSFLGSSSFLSSFKKPRLIQKPIQILIDCS